MRLYYVVVSDWGADRERVLYFRSFNRAESFSNSRDYCDGPYPINLDDDEAEKALISTDYYLESDLF